MKGVVIAGGFIRAYYAGEVPSDMDLYFETKDQCQEACTLLRNAEWKQVYETKEATSFTKNNKIVQVISFINGGAEEILSKFDFTVCQVAIDGIEKNSADELKGILLMHNDFFEHLASRLLVFTNSSRPLSSLKRVIKYIKRGYSICDGNIIRIARAIAVTVDFSDPEALRKHTAGFNSEIRAID